MSQPDPKSDTSTLGARLDAVLAPFAQDEQRLEKSIAELEAKVAKLNAEIEGSRVDLDVVRSSKIESLREAAKSDPLLSLAFAGMASGAASAQAAPAVTSPSAKGPAPSNSDSEVPGLVEEDPAPRGHSLLQM